ncbi:tetraspanin-19-like [Corylus avellana]|uniref:tetraspanin-19-like n=1 Tax=Corylus avellana TaxID=13451 RepID=UPI00286CE17A|nr:tetraspanin-19-like [Corylus avellana]
MCPHSQAHVLNIASLKINIVYGDHHFEDFVESNFDICKWIGLLITLAQGLSILLAVALRTLGPNHGFYYNYDSDEDYAPERLPLINNKAQPPPYVNVISDPRFATNNNTWNANK